MPRKPETIGFWTGRLPHREVAEGRYFITVHLAGAIPKEGQDRIYALAAEHNSIPEYDTQARLRLQRRIYLEMAAWLDRVDHVTHLQRPEVASVLTEAIAFRHGRTWNVLEYVVMPSHLHLFVEVLNNSLKYTMEQFKRWTGHEAAKVLDLNKESFWQNEWFDHWSRSDEEDVRIMEYIRQNPVKAKLVSRYEDWPYGSWKHKVSKSKLPDRH